MPRRIPKVGCRYRAWTLAALYALTTALAGCAAVTRDVALYYRQMATNFKEAEEKAVADVETRQREANLLLKAGDVNRFRRAMRNVGRLKDWQEHCARQRERFEDAARKLEPAGDPAAGSATTQSVPAS